MKRFNVTGTCYPDEHYMVDIHDRLELIARMVARGDYFCINAGRQYGKTTTLSMLRKTLESDYSVFSISFERLSDNAFESMERFGTECIGMLNRCIKFRTVRNISNEVRDYLQQLSRRETVSERQFSDALTEINAISTVPMVLLIDEVDRAGNFTVFIQFLGLLRDMFLQRKDYPTFQSVILAGVYDIKNLKLKIRPESEHQYNSPWNIATQFDVDMSLSADGIEAMLAEYKNDHAGIPEADCMDARKMAKLLRDYTSGYPFLVSRLCQIIDEKKLRWNRAGFLTAEKDLLHERNTLFDDLVKKLHEFAEMRKMFRDILLNGRKFAFNPLEHHIQLASLFGLIRESNRTVAISNRIFETVLYDLILSEDEMGYLSKEGSIDRNQFIRDGRLDMDRLLSRFAVHFNDIYGKNDDAFVEEMGRKLFLLYLKPIINGVGNYYVEAETRDETRTDVVVDYLGQQYVIELKIWRGNAYNERGEKQIAEYLDYYHATKGYLVSFCFNKNKTPGTKTVQIGDKTITEAVI